VLVVPNAVVVPRSPRRRHLTSLAGLDVAGLRAVYSDLNLLGERTA